MKTIKKHNEKVKWNELEKEIKWALEVAGLTKREIEMMLKVVRPKKNYGI